MQIEYYLALIYRMGVSEKQYVLTQETDHDVMAMTQYKGLKEWAEINRLLEGWLIVLFHRGKAIQTHNRNAECLEKVKWIPNPEDRPNSIFSKPKPPKNERN